MELLFKIIMLLTSVIGLAFIVERGLALRGNRVIPPGIENAAEACRTRPTARCCAACANNPNRRSAVCCWLPSSIWTMPSEENESALQTRARQEMVRLERGLVVLEIVVGIAPLLGLVGTIYGMMTLVRRPRRIGLGRQHRARQRHLAHFAVHNDGTAHRHSLAHRLELLQQKSRDARRGNGNRLRGIPAPPVPGSRNRPEATK